METRLAQRRYRFGWRLFTGATTWLKWWLLTGIVLIPVLSALLADVFELGLWSITAAVLQWFAAGTAGMLLFGNLAVWVSRGCTRREITVAFMLFGVLASVALAAYLTLGFIAEHALMALVDEPPTSFGAALASGVRYLAITPVYCFAGVLVAALATRYGGSGGFTTAVLFGTGALYAATLYLEFNDAWFDPGRSTALSAIAAIVLAAALAAGCAAALRSIPVRGKQA
ncbi:hypothetical protein [Glycomyces algeriensis]|uniref:Uncharacterized protein n=1 Tax=Glycomyces algeriensis TaxID=256037 RepID=A0A9W6GC88_9ACTN|nr:hypothetical protein [Glycomyces algeriensis]MDA1365772.1 hypothetical protein [Glycomyces algeriensis]MDR7351461.1 small-conductance mechanosensitive channel [Glycomyces algeriensis]GLI44182.1 hypothetical protein GALLR39Z86_40320 [Glycomyces algeriensis]